MFSDTTKEKIWVIFVNFKRRPGDYSGLAGSKEDGATYTTNVVTGKPNAYGLYNMAGNVSEWVKDVYRPMSSADISNLNGFRVEMCLLPTVWMFRIIP